MRAPSLHPGGGRMSATSSTVAPSRLARIEVPPTVIISFVVVALVIAWSLAPGLFTSQDPATGIPAQKLLGPSAAHWFGTDHLGRDFYTRSSTAPPPR
jgi:peptide/nickel transport system permease protein